jgi:DNA-binding MarR family transcriptional regulator/N-acetylglutamate synthase-like GNAT family acetyltransferase
MTAMEVATIESIRNASRRLVRELGFMREGLAGVDLPPSAVHALLEIEARAGITAAELSGLLNLEKSSVSRMLRRLVDAGVVTELAVGTDGRAKPLSLTVLGRDTVASIHHFARRQVAGALEQLNLAQHGMVVDGLRLYADALAANRGVDRVSPIITVEAGYRAGALGWCAGTHGRYYAQEAGFGASFEALVAAGLAEFSGRLDRSCNRLWLALREGQIVGTVAIDGEDLGPGIAHLRWFIVGDGARGGGAGRKLLSAALSFCETQGFEAVHLWTFQGLHAARHLYEEEGFLLVEERPGLQWGTEVLEQRFVRSIMKQA